MADKVRVSRRADVPFSRLKILHDIIGSANGITAVKLANPPALIVSHLVRNQGGRSVCTNSIGNYHVLRVDFSSGGSTPGHGSLVRCWWWGSNGGHGSRSVVGMNLGLSLGDELDLSILLSWLKARVLVHVR